MTITAASNIGSIRVQRQLSLTSQALSKTFERLSSGLRINHAGDDPAGLQLADSLRADARVAAMAIRNANDAISLTSIMDAALSEIGNLLQRMAELAQQSANGIYTNTQRSALSSEFLALGSEIERIAVTTTFNGIYLLSSSQDISIQVGFDGSSASRITINAVLGTLNSLGLAASGSSALSYSIIATTSTASQLAAQNALSALNSAIDALGVSRGLVGAAESRLSSALNYLTVARENFLAAESRIRDADVAQEVADMVRLQVLQQAGTAVLAQVNQNPARVLDLLK